VPLSSVFAARSRVDFQSILGLSPLSADTLDSLLSSESFVVDSEDVVLRSLLALRYSMGFGSRTATAAPFEDPVLCGPTESLWVAGADWLMRPPPAPAPQLDSLIVREFPPLSEEFRAKRFNLLWWGSRNCFGAAATYV
jgi:hypothetical protein